MKRHRTGRRAKPRRGKAALCLRPLQESDLPQVAQIEARAYASPWPEEYFGYCLRAGLCCWVLERHGVIEAYGVMSVEAGTAHILNLCVRPASRRHGLGRRMLTHLIELAHRRLAETAVLEVRRSNFPARQLYQSMGFREVGVQPDYYRLGQGREDALVLARNV
jgi:ribosomal-protein-alanine N-acetyltransferase